MFGMFDGIFGEGFMAEAAEATLELCLLDELHKEELQDLDLDELDFDGI